MTALADRPTSLSAPPASLQGSPQVRRRILLLPLILVLLGGAGVWYLASRPRQEETRLVLQGNIDVRQVNLSFKVEGRIASLAVDEGDTVQAGQVLATLDKRYFHDEVRLARARRDQAAATLARLLHGARPEEIAQARAQVEERRATLERSRDDFARARRLVNQRAMSREEFDRMRAALGEEEARLKVAEETLRLVEAGPRYEDIDAARAQLAAEQAAVIQAERRLADSDLIAPGPGIILTRAREVGAIVAAGETVFTLTLPSPVWVRTYVGERDLGRIRPNMPAEVRTDSAPDRPYPGRIGFISPTAEFTPKTVETRELRTDLVYRLRVLVDNPDGGLRQGMPVTVILDLSAGGE